MMDINNIASQQVTTVLEEKYVIKFLVKEWTIPAENHTYRKLSINMSSLILRKRNH